MQKRLKAGVWPQALPSGVDFKEGHDFFAVFEGLLQQIESFAFIAKSDVDDRNLINGNVRLLRRLLHLIHHFMGFGSLSRHRIRISEITLRIRARAQTDRFVERGDRVIIFSLASLRPSEKEMTKPEIRVRLNHFARLLDGAIEVS